MPYSGANDAPVGDFLLFSGDVVTVDCGFVPAWLSDAAKGFQPLC